MSLSGDYVTVTGWSGSAVDGGKLMGRDPVANQRLNTTHELPSGMAWS